jgi:hypothetical protein
MQERQTARLMGMKPTGNGRRQRFAHIPMPRMTNTYMLAGKREPKEVLTSVKKRLYADNFGGGQVDVTPGKLVFSCDPRLGTCKLFGYSECHRTTIAHAVGEDEEPPKPGLVCKQSERLGLDVAGCARLAGPRRYGLEIEVGEHPRGNNPVCRDRSVPEQHAPPGIR